MTKDTTKPDLSTKLNAIVETIDQLCKARARQQVSIFVENSEGAAYHAENAAEAKRLLVDALKLMVHDLEGKDE